MGVADIFMGGVKFVPDFEREVSVEMVSDRDGSMGSLSERKRKAL